jgi:hypothetical protein
MRLRQLRRRGRPGRSVGVSEHCVPRLRRPRRQLPRPGRLTQHHPACRGPFQNGVAPRARCPGAYTSSRSPPPRAACMPAASSGARASPTVGVSGDGWLRRAGCRGSKPPRFPARFAGTVHAPAYRCKTLPPLEQVQANPTGMASTSWAGPTLRRLLCRWRSPTPPPCPPCPSAARTRAALRPPRARLGAGVAGMAGPCSAKGGPGRRRGR